MGKWSPLGTLSSVRCVCVGGGGEGLLDVPRWVPIWPAPDFDQDTGRVTKKDGSRGESTGRLLLCQA